MTTPKSVYDRIADSFILASEEVQNLPYLKQERERQVPKKPQLPKPVTPMDDDSSIDEALGPANVFSAPIPADELKRRVEKLPKDKRQRAYERYYDTLKLPPEGQGLLQSVNQPKGLTGGLKQVGRGLASAATTVGEIPGTILGGIAKAGIAGARAVDRTTPFAGQQQTAEELAYDLQPPTREGLRFQETDAANALKFVGELEANWQSTVRKPVAAGAIMILQQLLPGKGEELLTKYGENRRAGLNPYDSAVKASDETKLPFGLQGISELLLAPENAVLFAKPISTAAKLGVKRGAQAAKQASKTVATKIAAKDVFAQQLPDTLKGADDMIKKLAATRTQAKKSGVSSSTIEQLDDEIAAMREYRDNLFEMEMGEEKFAQWTDLQNQLYEAEAKLEGLRATKMSVPKFGTAERAEFGAARRAASAEGRPIKAEAPEIKALQTQVANLKDEIAELEASAERQVVPGPTPQVGQMQPGMGIGEKPPQGTLFGESVVTGGKGSLAPTEAARQAKIAKVKAGQTTLGETAAAPTPKANMPKTAPKGAEAVPPVEPIAPPISEGVPPAGKPPVADSPQIAKVKAEIAALKEKNRLWDERNAYGSLSSANESRAMADYNALRQKEKELASLTAPKGEGVPPGGIKNIRPSSAPSSEEKIVAMLESDVPTTPPAGKKPPVSGDGAEAATPPAPEPAFALDTPTALTQGAEIVKNMKPTVISSFIRKIPLAKQALEKVNPGAKMPDKMLGAWVGRSGVHSSLKTYANAGYQEVIGGLERAFGKEFAEGKAAQVKFIGSPAEEYLPKTGTFIDVVQRPSLYDLSEAQKQALRTWDEFNTSFLDTANSRFGTEIGKFEVPNGYYAPNFDKSEDALKVLENLGASERTALTRGRAKTRLYETAYDRWKANPVFDAETDPRKLLSSINEFKINASASKVFREGVGGKTKMEVMEELHPALVAQKAAVTSRIAALKARIDTAIRQQQAVGRQMQTGSTALKNLEEKAELLNEHIVSLGDEYGPELSYLSGQLREVLKQARTLDRKVLAAQTRSTAAGARKASLQSEFADAFADLQKIRRTYEGTSTGDYVHVQQGINRYFPSKEAGLIDEVLKTSSNSFIKFIDSVRMGVLSLDASPFFGVQAPMMWIADPLGATKQWVAGAGKAISTRDLLSPFKAETLARDVQANLQSAMDFSFHTGVPMGIGSPGEFGIGYFSKIPKLGPKLTRFNEGMFTAVTRGMWDNWTRMSEGLVKDGVSEQAAKAIAGDITTKIVPVLNSARLGQSQARAAALRAAFISVSFIQRPAEMTLNAATGIFKIGTGNISSLTATEKTAVKVALRAQATVTALSVTSAVLSARSRGKDELDAVRDVLNPNSARFMSIVVGTHYIPLGGPYRGLIKAMAPRKVLNSPVPVPFGGVGNYLLNRVTPAVSTQLRLLRDRDYFGRPILQGEFAERIGRFAAYELQGVVPISAQRAIEGGLSGETPGVIAQEAGVQVAGVNLGSYDAVREVRDEWAKELDEYYAIPTDPLKIGRGTEYPYNRDAYRKRNPDVDAKLFIVGAVSSLQTVTAAHKAAQLIQDNRINPQSLKAITDRMALRQDYAKAGRVLERNHVDTLIRLLGQDAGAAAPSKPFQFPPGMPSSKVVPLPSTPIERWSSISQQLSSSLLSALARVWYMGGKLTSEEEAKLKAIHQENSFNQPNFNVWLKQTLRQIQENSAVATFQEESVRGGLTPAMA